MEPEIAPVKLHSRYSAGAVIACVALAAAACAHAPRSAVAPDVALERRQSEFLAALAARDAERTAAFFADSAVMHVAGMPPIEGRSAIRQLYANLFGFMSASGATPEFMRVAAAGDMAYGTGSTTSEFRGPQGTVAYTGKYVLVWRRIAGAWQIVLYAISSNQPEAGR
jgi:ketosteroid isomerase-like protein